MKDYREMAKDVLERRDLYLAERRRKMKKYISLVSCICLAALLGVGAWQLGGLAGETPTDAGGGPAGDVQTDAGGGPDAGGMYRDGDPDGYGGAEDASPQSEEARQAITQEEGETDPLADLAQGQQTDSDSTACDPAADMPAQESPVSAGILNAYEEAWGGSYINEEGRTVILLTEDTPENRQKVFERNPDLLESNTEFRQAEYSLAYLTDLQEEISERMAAGKLPFVTVSAVREEINRIQVTVCLEDPDELEKLLALDETGGAIVVEYSSAGAVKEEMAREE